MGVMMFIRTIQVLYEDVQQLKSSAAAAQ